MALPKKRASSKPLPKTARTVVEQVAGLEIIEGNAVAFQLERVRCGKAKCRVCRAAGGGHGPYWYAYWRQRGGTRSLYIGKQLRSVQQVLDAKKGRKK